MEGSGITGEEEISDHSTVESGNAGPCVSTEMTDSFDAFPCLQLICTDFVFP